MTGPMAKLNAGQIEELVDDQFKEPCKMCPVMNESI